MTPIERHRTALVRTDLSRPVRMAMGDGVLTPDRDLFDYGCGHGGDLERLRALGYRCEGWDPVFRPEGSRGEADVVNLGYVVNVIEDPTERVATLRHAWQLARHILIVAARLTDELPNAVLDRFEDGCLTRTRTFQKFYEQSELREWINGTLSVNSVAAAPGVFYVFKDDAQRESFVAMRFRRRAAAPRLRRSDELFQEHRTLLEPLMAFFAERGRLPAEGELPQELEIREALGSIKQAFRVIYRVTGEEQWDAIREDRTEDLLIYLALARFDRRPSMSQLARDMQLDIRALFSNYRRACALADEVLYAAGNRKLIEAACGKSTVGKLTAGSLYVHESALSQLPPLLRLYEGCARAYVGTIEGANLIKLHHERPQVSYLSYPLFERDPHPRLAWSVLVDLQTFRIQPRSYVESKNPPILHRKELFVGAEHPLRERFARLTLQEEKAGLLEATERIGLLAAWQDLLRSHGFAIRRHRLVKVLASPNAIT